MKIQIVLASAVAAIVLPLAVSAQDAAPVRLNEACKTELSTLCAANADKGPRGIRCLTDNQAKLGASCAAAIKTTQDRREKLQAACKADAEKLCAGVQSKGGQFVACLRGKTAELSRPCLEAIAALPQPAAKK